MDKRCFNQARNLKVWSIFVSRALRFLDHSSNFLHNFFFFRISPSPKKQIFEEIFIINEEVNQSQKIKRKMEQSGAYAVPQGGFEIIEAAHGSGYSLRSSQDLVKKVTFLKFFNKS